MTTAPPASPRSQPPNAASAALTTSDTSSRKPSVRIIATEISRVRITPHRPRLGLGAIFQTEFSASCSSTTTPVAPMTSTPTLIMVPRIPCSGRLAFATTVCTSRAASEPSRPRSSPKIRPSAAAGPKTSPAIEITSNRSGAIENTV